ncbi:MAG: alpha/beta hydrolase [Dehalococcoidia bacterium]|jgi:pimeloyl-ACP methyl ester carboxylesterase|nr:alpha/beta hydrolase [Dehalococcoidia bacterium]
MPDPLMTDYSEQMKACAEAIELGISEYVLPSEHHTQINGIDFHYLDWGNDHLPHVVLLHGGALTAHTWDMACLLLRDKYHLVTPDQRGHGDSGWTSDEQLAGDNSGLMAEDTRQFIDHLGFHHFTLAGMSMGGMNSIRYAADHQERLDALCIIDIAPETMRVGIVEMEQFRQDTETMDRFEDFLKRAQMMVPHRAPAHLEYSLLHSLKPTEEGRWTWKQDHRGRRTPAAGAPEVSEDEMRAAREANADRMWDDLKSIKTPTLLMRGGISNVLALDAAERVVEAMPDCRLVEIPGAGHRVQGDNPKDFAAELDAFLSKTLA